MGSRCIRWKVGIAVHSPLRHDHLEFGSGSARKGRRPRPRISGKTCRLDPAPKPGKPLLPAGLGSFVTQTHAFARFAPGRVDAVQVGGDALARSVVRVLAGIEEPCPNRMFGSGALQPRACIAAGHGLGQKVAMLHGRAECGAIGKQATVSAFNSVQIR